MLKEYLYAKWSYNKGDFRVMGPLYTKSRTATALTI